MYLTDNDAAEVYADYEYFERSFDVECRICRWPATGSQYELELMGWHLSKERGEVCPQHAKEFEHEQHFPVSPADTADGGAVSESIRF